MKIRLAQLNYHTGNFEQNSRSMIEAIKEAKAARADLVVFSELSVCGYPAKDFLQYPDFIAYCEESLNRIAAHCTDGVAAIVGSPTLNPVVEGKDLYNSACFLTDGKVEKVVHKTLLPNYDVFDEYRYFEPNRSFEVISYKGFRIALTICEDLWNLNENPMYIHTPMEELKKQHPDLIVNIAASPFSQKQIETRHEVLAGNALKYELPLFYVNHIGAQTHLIFDGGSCVFDSKGKLLDELCYFDEQVQEYELKRNERLEIGKSSSWNINLARNKYEDIEAALELGIKEYFKKQGFSKAILGLSGGVDSALVCCLATHALGAENVKPILLPSQFSSQHSISDSEELAQNLGLCCETISIEKTYAALEKSLKHQFAGTAFGLAEENMQSRSRAVLLMAMANKFGYILLNTSNKSELAVGYGTLYGDMCGGLSVIGDLYKTEVYELCHYLNRDKEIIPSHILRKEPSAELRPGQKDSDSLPPYEILDKILYHYIEECRGPEAIIKLGFDEQVLRKVLKLVNTNEWKRLQAPPVLRVSTRAFGPGRRLPIVAKYLS